MKTVLFQRRYKSVVPTSFDQFFIANDLDHHFFVRNFIEIRTCLDHVCHTPSNRGFLAFFRLSVNIETTER